jgi:hypothetical protein
MPDWPGAVHSLHMEVIASGGLASCTGAPRRCAVNWPHKVNALAMQVRDTELDQFSVVNNNIYGIYMQHGG